MAQVTDRNIGANPTGFDMRTELNNIISALETDNSGSSEPLNTVAYMKWLDTSNATYYYVKERNHNNTAWVTLFRYTVATKIMEAVSNGVVLQDSNLVHNTGDETIAGLKTFSGNVGIGVAPSAWDSMGNVTAYSVGSPSMQFLVGANAYYNSGHKYASTGVASQYEQYNGIHYWKTAPSGIVGNPITWNTAMTLDAGGNLLLTGSGGLGYGTGSGGTVTQLTSKAANVTLNKPSGQITMHNASLAAGATVGFQFNNSSLTSKDSIEITIDGSSMTLGHDLYDIRKTILNGYAIITLVNRHTAVLAEAVRLNFNVIKGSIN